MKSAAHNNRTAITRVTVGISLLFVLWRMSAGLSLLQLQQPTIFKNDADFSYWALKVFGIADLLISNSLAAIAFTIIFIGSGLLLLFFTRKKIFAWIFAISYFIYSILINLYACHSMHYMSGFSIILFAFCAKRDEQFFLSWELMRYYICFMYSMVFLMKLINGAFVDWDSGYVFFQGNITEYLYHNPNTFLSTIYQWFLLHPFIVNLGAKFIYLLEGVFLIGFFTKRFDSFLIIAAVLIFLSTYFFVDVFFAELLFAIICPLLGNRFWMKFQSITMIPTKNYSFVE
jgi:hypothetical protein